MDILAEIREAEEKAGVIAEKAEAEASRIAAEALAKCEAADKAALVCARDRAAQMMKEAEAEAEKRSAEKADAYAAELRKVRAQADGGMEDAVRKITGAVMEQAR